MTEKSTRTVQNRIPVESFLVDVDLYLMDEETAIIYSRLKASIFTHFAPEDKNKRRSTSMSKLGFSDRDLWIAATTIQHSLTLVSSDSDFK
jgi:tRNA(fMet)-specific endonuclease VapC